jgi:hypothetical protein
MPFVNNAANAIALQNAANVENGLTSIGQALNNPQAWANADLLRAHKALTEAQTKKELNDIALGTALNQANVGNVNAEAALRKQQLDAFNASYNNLVANGVPHAKAKLVAGVWAAGRGTSQDLANSLGSTVGTVDQMALPVNANEAQTRQAVLLRDPKVNVAAGLTPAYNIANEGNKPVVANNRVINPAMVPQISPMSNQNLLSAAYGNQVPTGLGAQLQAPTAQQSSSTTQTPQNQGLGSTLGDATVQPGMITLPWKNANPVSVPTNPLLPQPGIDPALSRKAWNEFIGDKATGTTQANLTSLNYLRDLINHQASNQQGDVTMGPGAGVPLTKLPLGLSKTLGIATGADTEFDKTRANLQQAGGGLGALLGGRNTDFSLGVAGEGTVDRANTKQANLNLLNHSINQVNQLVAAKDFGSELVDHGVPAEQAIAFVRKYASDPDVYPMVTQAKDVKGNVVEVKQSDLPNLLSQGYSAIPNAKVARSETPIPVQQYYANAVNSWKPENDVIGQAIQNGGTVPDSVVKGLGSAINQPAGSSQLTPAEQAELMARRAHAAKGMQTGGGF